ncbi:hypothetical protein [Actinophytocola oryzae]|uniref:Extracellular solute-binding protein n=1 Tax=Actinophytocola oryzae TaxID=502181 RepID=A0A4R7W3W2_9PSEU|nr:hypothetical protein [Actinophytocola oryzae]TDV57182.1 hypothetical protein CLV71_10153 [Actinophytocola oryzae]
MARSRAGLAGVRIVALVAGVVLIIVAVVLVTRHEKGQAGGCDEPATTVRGVIGSEKQAFFDDTRVTDRLACLGFRVEVDASGSRDMVQALHRDDGYAFAFPSSTPTAETILTEFRLTEKIPLFSTPMIVATFRPIVDLLADNGVVAQAADGSRVLDVAALLRLAEQGTTWDQLANNDNRFTAHKTVLLSTTDPLDSNSAIMYLSIASQVANGGAIVTTPQQVDAVLPRLCRLVADQGDKPETSQVLFDNYLVYGMGRTPMALVYESQYVTRAPKPELPPDAVKLFPRPTVYSRHTLIPLTPDGGAVGKALRDDPELVRLAVEHGFRPERPVSGEQLGERPVDVVESPDFDVLETMLSDLSPTSGRCAR